MLGARLHSPLRHYEGMGDPELAHRRRGRCRSDRHGVEIGGSETRLIVFPINHSNVRVSIVAVDESVLGVDSAPQIKLRNEVDTIQTPHT